MFVPTRSSQLKSVTADSYQTIVYENKKGEGTHLTSKNNKIGEKPFDSSKVETGKKKKDSKWNMKKLRYDIIKFGTTGFRGAKKEESKIALAVSLGAEPPKKKYINYKDLVKMKKAEKIEAVQSKKLTKMKNNKKSKAKTKKNPKKRGGKR